MKNKKIFILAHRGFSKKYPENTKLAFTKAISSNADGIECDVQKTKDGRYVVIHDDNLKRVSGKDFNVYEMTLKELQQVKLKNNQRILELSELLKIIPENKIINIELKKETLIEKDSSLIEMILLKNAKKENLILSSFSYKLLEHFRDKNYRIALLLPEDYDRINPFRFFFTTIKYKPEFLNLPVKFFIKMNFLLSNIILRLIRMFGVKLIFWTVEDKRDFERIVFFADGLIANNPELMIDLLKKRSLTNGKS